MIKKRMFMITELRGMLKSHVYRIFLWVFLAVLIFGGMSFDYSKLDDKRLLGLDSERDFE